MKKIQRLTTPKLQGIEYSTYTCVICILGCSAFWWFKKCRL